MAPVRHLVLGHGSLSMHVFLCIEQIKCESRLSTSPSRGRSSVEGRKPKREAVGGGCGGDGAARRAWGLTGNRCLDLALPGAADKFPGGRPPAAAAATYPPGYRSMPFLLVPYACPRAIF